MPVLAHLLLAAALASDSLQDADSAATLARMQRSFQSLESLEVTLRIVERPAEGERRHYIMKAWIHPPSKRVRTEFRTPTRPTPFLSMVASPRGMLAYQADAHELAQLPMPMDLAAALAATRAGELLRCAQHGGLAGVAAATAYSAQQMGTAELIGSQSCEVVRFIGNRTATLWLDEEDHLPRQLHVPLLGMIREETVVSCRLNGKLANSLFELQPAGAKVLPFAQAQQSWRLLAPGSSRWPAVGSVLPAITVLDLEENSMPLVMEDDRQVLALWFSGSEVVVDRLFVMEASLRRRFRAIPLLSIHHGADVARWQQACEQLEFDHDTLLAGDHADNAFATLRIGECPVFFVLDAERKILHRSAEPDAILKFLQGTSAP